MSASTGGGVPAVPTGFDVDARWIVCANGIQELFGGAEPVQLGRDRTDLASALERAVARAPGRDVLVCTDGRSTERDVEEAARALRRAGGRVFTTAPARPAADVGIVEAHASGGPLGLRVDVQLAASVTGEVIVELVEGIEVLARTPVPVTPDGPVRTVLRDPGPADRARTLQVRLVPSAATPNDDRGNDRVVLGWRAPPRRVVLVGSRTETAALASAGLAPSASLQLETVARLTEEVLATADVVVVLGSPWRRLARGAAALPRFVGQGGRLLLVGGPAAWRAGGWQGRAVLQRLSPLRVRAEPGEPARVLLVLDRSGSTAGTALTHLRAAARSVLQGLPTDERLAVLPFGGPPREALLSPGWVSRGARDESRAWLEALGRLDAGGRTDLVGALRIAEARLAGFADARRRLLVLLTDGDPDRPPRAESFRDVAASLDAAKIDRLALVVGDRVAWEALRDGLTTHPRDCLLLETSDKLEERLRIALAARRLDQERLQRPEGFDLVGDEVPSPLRPRVLHALETVPAAELLIRAQDGPGGGAVSWPFLARRSHGAGEVFAFAWGPSLEMPGSAARAPGWTLLAKVARQAAAESRRGLEGRWVGSAVEIEAPSLAGRGTIAWSSEGASGTLVEVRPGVFGGEVPAAAADSLRLGAPGEGMVPIRMPSRPPVEHRGVGIDDAALERLARAGGGLRLAPGEARPPLPRGPGIPLAPWMLGLAALFLVMERAWRPRRELPDP